MKTVVVGMSGGVDSSVAAYILKEQGYNVIGLFMVNWEEVDGTCTADADYEDVKRVCNAIGIPYYTVNYTKEYYNNVFSYFLESYKKGRTPNPDVLCNREVKFGPFLKHALTLGADYVATGHYAKLEEKDGLFYLQKSFDQNKDQTYFLNQLSQEQLKYAMFPLADIDKPKVREIAAKLNLSTAEKKDSTGICFIGERNFKNFLKTYLPMQSGEIRNLQEEVLGKHDGLMYYTLGQRRGLGIGGRKDSTGERYFVVKKDLANNVLYVTQGEGEELLSDGLFSGVFNFIPQTPKQKEFDCFAKFRYRQSDQKVRVQILEDGTTHIKFYEPQRAVTVGQYVVLYDENGNCLGGAEIEKTYKK